MIDLLKAYFRIGERDDHREMREKVTGKLLTLDRALSRSFPCCSRFCRCRSTTPGGPPSIPPAPSAHARCGRQLLLREARAQSLLVVFEDLHWIDSESQALLDALVESLPVARLLLLVNYRPEYQHGWGAKSDYRQLRLDAAPRGERRGATASLLGDEPTLASLKALLIGRTRGIRSSSKRACGRWWRPARLRASAARTGSPILWR